MLENLSGKRAAVRLLSAAVAALLLLTACQTTALDPAAEKLAAALEDGVDLASFKPDPDLRVRYLPPVGSGKPKGEFAVGMPLEVATFRLAPGDQEAEGEPLVPLLSTKTVGVSVSGDTYVLSWPVIDPNVAERVRIEIRMVGSGDAPVCNEYGGECLGFLDVRVVEGGGPGHGGGSSKGLITVPSGGTFKVSFKVQVPRSVEELAELSGQGGLDVEHGNCPADEVALPSQGLRAVGAGLRAVGAGLRAVGAGGLFVADRDDLLAKAVSTTDIAASFPDIHAGHEGKDVALLVVDDFGGTFRLPDVLTRGDLTTIDQVYLERLVATGQVSHGAIVFHELVALMTSLLGEGKRGVDPALDAPYVQFGGHYKPRLRIQAVDARSETTGEIDTDTAADGLIKALAAVQDAHFKHVVVNMSFAIVPCGVLEDFTRAAEDPDFADDFVFQEYLDALLDLNGVRGETRAELRKLVHGPVELSSDPLFAQLACPGDDGAPCGDGLRSLVFVAASGNYGLGFALHPAAFPSVVSVGSQSVLGGVSTFSNAADIVAPGELVLLRTRGGAGLAIAGTSFAAPIVSAFVALDLRSGSPSCAPSDPADPTVRPPELASGDRDELPLLEAVALCTGG